MASRDMRGVMRRLKLKLVLYVVGGLFGLIAFGFLLAALTIWIGDHMTPFEACVTMALALGAISGATFATVAVLNHRDRKRRRKNAVTGDVGRAAMIAVSASVLPLLLRNKTLISMIAIAGAAFMVFSGGNTDEDI
jgi:hypothetical protein